MWTTASRKKIAVINHVCCVYSEYFSSCFSRLTKKSAVEFHNSVPCCLKLFNQNKTVQPFPQSAIFCPCELSTVVHKNRSVCTLSSSVILPGKGMRSSWERTNSALPHNCPATARPSHGHLMALWSSVLLSNVLLWNESCNLAFRAGLLILYDHLCTNQYN